MASGLTLWCGEFGRHPARLRKPPGKGFYPRNGTIMPFDASPAVNETTIEYAAEALGARLREVRRANKISQRRLAAVAGIDLATVQGLEQGQGTLRSLLAVLGVLELRFDNQLPFLGVGKWIANVRKAMGYSQATLATLIGLSKPTIINIEHGRGNLRSLLQMMCFLRLVPTVVPQTNPLNGARLILGDCLEVLPSLPDHSINAVIVDLPYSLTNLAWDEAIPLAPLWEQFRRVLKPTGAVVLTASQPFTAELVMSNPTWFKEALVWEKSRATGFLQASKRHLKKHEDILVFSPGTIVSGSARQTARNMTYNPQGLVELEGPLRSRSGIMNSDTLADTGGQNTLSPIYRPCYIKPNTKRNGEPATYNGDQIRGRGRNQTHTNYPTSVLRYPSEPKPIHPTQKPLELMRYLVRTFTNEGDTILDCCFGSGTTAVAAVMEGRQFVGVERDPTYFQMASERLNKITPPINGLSAIRPF